MEICGGLNHKYYHCPSSHQLYLSASWPCHCCLFDTSMGIATKHESHQYVILWSEILVPYTQALCSWLVHMVPIDCLPSCDEILILFQVKSFVCKGDDYFKIKCNQVILHATRGDSLQHILTWLSRRTPECQCWWFPQFSDCAFYL